MKSLRKSQPLESLSGEKKGLDSLKSTVKKATDAAKGTGAAVVVEVEAENDSGESNYPKEARIKKAENGFIVCWYEHGKEYMMGGEKSYVAKDLAEAMGEIEKYMG